jgi:transposase
MTETKAEGTGGRRRYTEEFKRSAVEHWLSSGRSAERVARELGISPYNLRDWRYRYTPALKPVDAPVPESPEAMKAEVCRLRKELARVIAQRDILKKTLGIVSEP